MPSARQHGKARCHRNIPFAGNNDGLARTVSTHGRVRILSNGKQVWLELSSTATIIRLNDLRSIEGDALEGIHGNQDDTTVGIDAMLGITVSNGMQY